MQTVVSYTTEAPRVTEPRPYMEHELLAEIFQMLPESVLADMYDLANALFYNVMQGTADRLATECPEKRREIKAALDTYQVAAEKMLDEVFNVFQQYVSQSAWKIPDDLDVQFDHHKDIDFNISSQDLQDMDQQLDDLRNKIKAQKQFKAVLTHTHDKHQRDIKQVDAMLESMAFLREIPLQENVPDVNNTMLFVKEQIEYIKDAVIKVASEDLSSLPPDKRTLHLRSKFQLYMDRLLQQYQPSSQ
ncbi:ATP citrate lyase subunit 1 [Mucor velutinosus]|uniref:ATP citrate lyase subunit 1 n=1 Tax=Mucor velutinosus TaxID=708070 RepID=A0AAN7I3W0_9FUNG|nr:ATP citrate lyase subunit 1 [Mucor velutinosus]